MNCLFTIVFGIYGLLALVGNLAPSACEATAERHAVRIVARSPDGSRLEDQAPEVYGGHGFYQKVGDGRVFALVPREHGWSIRLYSGGVIAEATELSGITPPHGGSPNPRDIFGWHFRNAGNTGPNRGDVNAPQETRVFFFMRTPGREGGFRPSTNPGTPRFPEPDPGDGVGWLRVLDYGLSDLEPGQKARMTYLKFEACISWPKSEEEIREDLQATSPLFLPEEVATFGSCGFDLSAYELHAAILPRGQVGDLDGDGSLDHFAQIRRRSDGKRGLVLCRAGTWLQVLGMDERSIGEALRPGFFDRMEAWRLVGKDHGRFGYEGEPHWPESDGDILVLERVEKEMILLYWAGGGLCSQQVYRYVEP